jgi:Virulence factor BrkB
MAGISRETKSQRVSSMAVIMAVVMAVVGLAILGRDHSKKPIPAPRRSIGEPQLSPHSCPPMHWSPTLTPFAKPPFELSAFLPPEAAKLLIDALSGLVDKATSKLSLGLILGVLIALWSARAGMSALMTGLNIADEEEEKRGFIDQQIVALFLTIGALIVASVAVVALAVIPLCLPSSRSEITPASPLAWRGGRSSLS